MPSLVVRPVRHEDVRALAEVHARTWEEAYRGLVPDEIIQARSIEERERIWHEMLDRGDSVHFVGEVNGVVAGFVSVGPAREPDRLLSGELYAIYVREAQWGSGLAVELILAGEQALRELGYSHATLWVLRDNPRARAFYEKQGWRSDGSEKDFVPGVIEVRYERDLDER
jgi:ribosomal protein S18 acetylase RimI-like enzyme